MKFLYPQFLYALALVAIPIIIHLFNFRKFKTVHFSNVQFLKSVKEKTKSQSQLKHLLVLLSRVLAITALVLAFAQPYIPIDDSTQQAKKHAVSIYIDNSFSMDGENENGRLLLTAKQQAQSVMEAYTNTDEFYILNNDFKTIHQRALSKEQFTNALNALESSSKTRTLNQIFKRQKNTLEKSNADKKDIYIISDFQNSISDLSVELEDSIYSIRFVPLNAYQNTNLYIDSCWLNTPNPQQQNNIKLFAKIKTSQPSNNQDINLKLEINNQQKAIATGELSDESIVELNFNVQQVGWHNAVLSIQDYPVTFDDKYYFSFEVKPKLNVQHIYHKEAHSSIQKLFASDPYFNFTTQNINQLNYSNLSQNQLVVLSNIKTLSSGLQQSLKTVVENGTTIIIFPSSSLDIANFKNFSQLMNIDEYIALTEASNTIKSIDNQHQLFEGVFEDFDKRLNFPEVKKYFNISPYSKRAVNSILSFENNKSFFNEYSIGKGKVYLSSVGLDDTFGNFSKHALFVPILYNIASYSGGKQDLSYTIGQENIPFQSSKLKAPLFLKNGDQEFIPETRGNELWISDQISSAGHYELKDNDNTTLAFLSFNYNRMESDISMMDTEQLKILSQKQSNIIWLEKELSNLSRYLEELNTGIPLWISCILLALFLLFVETLLIRLL